ncbi:MAG: DNA polymerase III subunit beta [Bacteroidales bacterium]|jgi:DNA polymerase-3 subunit beta|nr:DNA polymerase III subunit beta [Bacteroidales bacterium]
MKFIVNSQALLKKLKVVGPLAGTSKSLPILNNLLFELDKSTLYITGSDSETTIRVSLELTDAADAGAIAIPAKTLIDLLNLLPDIPVSFLINEETCEISITAGKGNYTLMGEKTDFFPIMSFDNEVVSAEYSPEAVVDGIQRTVFATSDDELRPSMCGVKFELHPNSLDFVSTNAHVLVKYSRIDQKGSTEADFIVHKKSLNTVKNVLSEYMKQEGIVVKLSLNDKNVKFTLPEPNVSIVCRLIDGKFPNYNNIIPQNNTNILVVNKDEIKRTIARVSVFSEKSTGLIKFTVQGQEMTIRSEARDFGQAANDKIACNYEGEGMEIGFNASFLSNMLNSLDSEEVRFELKDEKSSALIFPVEKVENEDVLMLIMPLMTN